MHFLKLRANFQVIVANLCKNRFHMGTWRIWRQQRRSSWFLFLVWPKTLEQLWLPTGSGERKRNTLHHKSYKCISCYIYLYIVNSDEPKCRLLNGSGVFASSVDIRSTKFCLLRPEADQRRRNPMWLGSDTERSHDLHWRPLALGIKLGQWLHLRS